MISRIGAYSGSRDNEEEYGQAQPINFARIDPTSRLPLYRAKEHPMPYACQPPSASRTITRKRYIIMNPNNGHRPVFPGVRVVRQMKEQTIQRRNASIYPSSWSSHSSTITSPSNSNYVFKVNRLREEKPPKMSPMKMMYHNNDMGSSIDSSIPLHIPTVPASMSMGGEYTEEEEIDDQDDVIESAENSSAYFESAIKIKPETVGYNCLEMDCFWRGSSIPALKRHMTTVHPKDVQMVLSNNKVVTTTDKPPSKPKGVRCSECDTLAYSRPLLLKHMTNTHGFEAPLINKTFESREELQSWLEELRTTHAVEFVVSSGSKKWGYGLQVHYLTCSRSGDQKERPNKKYSRPPRPSIKCGKNCMAYLKIKQNPVTSVLQIEGCLYHSGHMIDGNLIKLTVAEQRKIAIIADQYERDLLHWDEENMGGAREILGTSGRFRLIPDISLAGLLHTWIKDLADQKRAEKEDLGPTFYGSMSAPSLNNKYSNADDFDIFSNNMILDSFDDYPEESSLLSDTH